MHRLQQLRWANASVCSATRGQRLSYGLVAVIMAAFGVALFGDNALIGVIGVLIALATALMAITGLCWSDWLNLRSTPSPQPGDVLGFPYAPGMIRLGQHDG